MQRPLCISQNYAKCALWHPIVSQEYLLYCTVQYIAFFYCAMSLDLNGYGTAQYNTFHTPRDDFGVKFAAGLYLPTKR